MNALTSYPRLTNYGEGEDGEGPRFIDLYTEDTILFKNICAKEESENCNYF